MTTLAPLATTLASHGIARRAIIIGVTVGVALTLFNRNYLPVHWPTLVVTFLTPMILVATSQAVGIRRAILDHRAGRPAPRSFGAAAIGHGIPARSLAIALTSGLALATILGALQVLSGNAHQPAGYGPAAQAMIIGFFVSTASQGIAMRRARARIAA